MPSSHTLLWLRFGLSCLTLFSVLSSARCVHAFFRALQNLSTTHSTLIPFSATLTCAFPFQSLSQLDDGQGTAADGGSSTQSDDGFFERCIGKCKAKESMFSPALALNSFSCLRYVFLYSRRRTGKRTFLFFSFATVSFVSLCSFPRFPPTFPL